jgi:hypothetical protein
MSRCNTISLTVEDFTGQNSQCARGVPTDATVGELIASLTREMRLPVNDSGGRPLSYAARANGESLIESDRIGDVLQEKDVVTLTQNVTAG